VLSTLSSINEEGITMNRINYRRVVGGGLLAGLVLGAGELVLNELVLGERWLEMMESMGLEPVGPGSLFVYVIMMFVLGIAIVWLYAAIRPRFGPGPSTAILNGLFVWFLVWVWGFGGSAVWGFFPADIVWIVVIWGLAEVVAASVAGAWLYQEGSKAKYVAPAM
jgi:hypothetical protein